METLELSRALERDIRNMVRQLVSQCRFILTAGTGIYLCRYTISQATLYPCEELREHAGIIPNIDWGEVKATGSGFVTSKEINLTCHTEINSNVTLTFVHFVSFLSAGEQ